MTRLLASLVLLCCERAHGFRAALARAPALRRSSMAEDMYEAPSDSYAGESDAAAVDAAPWVDMVDVTDVDAVTRELLVKCAASARGQARGGGVGADVERLAATLEDRRAAVALDAVCGRWSLAYCSTQLFRSSPFWMAGRATCADGAEARRYDWFCEMHRAATMVSEIGAVRQLVSRDTLVSEFETSVAAFPMRVGGSMPLTITGAIVSTADVVAVHGEGPLDLVLEQGDVEIKGSNLPGVRQALDAGLKLDSRMVNDALPNVPRPKPAFTTTYVDDTVRISRDCDRNLFVYVKEGDDPAPTSYDDVPADLGVPAVLAGALAALTGAGS